MCLWYRLNSVTAADHSQRQPVDHGQRQPLITAPAFALRASARQALRRIHDGHEEHEDHEGRRFGIRVY